MKKKTLAMCLSGALLFGSLSGIALADYKNLSSDSKNFTKFEQNQHVKLAKHPGMLQKQEIMKEALAQLVKASTIDQKKADEVQSYVDKKAKEREEHFNQLKNATPEERKALKEKWFAEKKKAGFKKKAFVNELVTNKILTQEQADAFKAKVKEIANQKHQQRITDALKGLVTAKTISQEQADEINKAFAANQKEREELFAKIKDMTKDERIAYFKNNKAKFVNPVAKLVEDGVLTKAQGDEVYKALGCGKGPKMRFGKKGFAKGFHKDFNVGL